MKDMKIMKGKLGREDQNVMFFMVILVLLR